MKTVQPKKRIAVCLMALFTIMYFCAVPPLTARAEPEYTATQTTSMPTDEDPSVKMDVPTGADVFLQVTRDTYPEWGVSAANPKKEKDSVAASGANYWEVCYTATDGTNTCTYYVYYKISDVFDRTQTDPDDIIRPVMDAVTTYNSGGVSVTKAELTVDGSDNVVVQPGSNYDDENAPLAEEEDSSLISAISRVMGIIFTAIGTWLIGPGIYAVCTFLSGLLGDFFTWVAGPMLDDFSVNPKTFTAYFSGNYDFLNIFRYLAYAILLLVFIFTLWQMLHGPIMDQHDTPLRFAARVFIFGLFTANTYAILNVLIIYGLKIESAVLSFRREVTADSFLNLAVASETVSVLNNIIVLIMILLIVWNAFKLLLEVVERWVFTSIMALLSPCAMAFGISVTTSKVTTTFFKTYLGQLFILVINKWFLIAVAIVSAYASEALGSGDAAADLIDGMRPIDQQSFLFLLMVLGLLKVAQRFDDYMRDMGFSVARTGQGLTMEFLSGMTAARTLLRAGGRAAGTVSGAVGVSSAAGRAGDAAAKAGIAGVGLAGKERTAASRAFYAAAGKEPLMRNLPQGTKASNINSASETLFRKEQEAAAKQAASQRGIAGAVGKGVSEQAYGAAQHRGYQGQAAADILNSRDSGFGRGVYATTASHLDYASGTGHAVTTSGSAYDLSLTPKAGYHKMGNSEWYGKETQKGNAPLGYKGSAGVGVEQAAQMSGHNFRMGGGATANSDGTFTFRDANGNPVRVSSEDGKRALALNDAYDRMEKTGSASQDLGRGFTLESDGLVHTEEGAAMTPGQYLGYASAQEGGSMGGLSEQTLNNAFDQISGDAAPGQYTIRDNGNGTSDIMAISPDGEVSGRYATFGQADTMRDLYGTEAFSNETARGYIEPDGGDASSQILSMRTAGGADTWRSTSPFESESVNGFSTESVMSMMNETKMSEDSGISRAAYLGYDNMTPQAKEMQRDIGITYSAAANGGYQERIEVENGAGYYLSDIRRDSGFRAVWADSASIDAVADDTSVQGVLYVPLADLKSTKNIGNCKVYSTQKGEKVAAIQIHESNVRNRDQAREKAIDRIEKFFKPRN